MAIENCSLKLEFGSRNSNMGHRHRSAPSSRSDSTRDQAAALRWQCFWPLMTLWEAELVTASRAWLGEFLPLTLVFELLSGKQATAAPDWSSQQQSMSLVKPGMARPAEVLS
ncbi:hypothetical protein H109_00413 [Trichophyton interdigitale MR816]|uniref:Uncharacterized protein n=1 Tax=Trichophyton interdigitale (strain MR816) TaxID=1215338 RepID=A0A059JIX6_TRIIM|nr:hypothetical protein H109_00413 [Trichophyton interdigitale MR816]